MRKLFCKTALVLLIVGFINNSSVNAQCTNVSLNWDYLDYFSYTNNYTSAQGYLSSNLLSKTQSFAFGTQRVTIAHTYADGNSLGENGNNTAESGSYGAGDDVQFIGNGSITITFDNSVSNLKFSLYDVDRNQRIQFNAVNGGTPVAINLSKVSGSIVSFTNNGTTTARVDANNTTVSNTNTDGTVNVSVAGPVTQLTLTISNTGTCSSSCGTGGSEDGSFFLSDITACSNGSFATNYYSISRPFTGQSAYVLVAIDRSIYMVNPTDGNAKLMFTDNTTPFGPITSSNKCNINSFAYDPYKRILYYVYSLTDDPGINRMLRKYDFNTGTISTVLSDITSTTYGTGVGIPLVTSTSGISNRGIGLESAGAAFYDGVLYLGVETTNKSSATSTLSTSARETVIWKIEFDASDIPYRASQLYALPVDNGSGTLTHDWSDFVINNGVLYDFDGARATTGSPETDIYQMDLLTRSVVNYDNPQTTYPITSERFVPGQVSIDWSGTIYNITTTDVTGSTISPYIAAYNASTGRIGTKFNITNPSIPASPSVGDAGEAFRPLADFGDAPSTYDTDPWSPALHEYDANLHLGATFDVEWNKTSSSNADADGSDEDGITGTLTVGTGTTSFSFPVSVYNNTGANATLVAWIDLNKDGVFQSTEGKSYTVASSSSQQSVTIGWSSVNVSAPVGSKIFLRVRLTSASNGMTTSSPSGYFSNGEVEDYPVNVSLVLPGNITFSASKLNNSSAELVWSSTNELNTLKYIVQRSADGINFENLYEINPGASYGSYKFIDTKPYKPETFYRVVSKNNNTSDQFTNTAMLTFKQISTIAISPNPASNYVYVDVASVSGGEASISVIDMKGQVIHVQKQLLFSGNNKVNLSGIEKLNNGLYRVVVQLNSEILTTSLIISK